MEYITGTWLGRVLKTLHRPMSRANLVPCIIIACQCDSRPVYAHRSAMVLLTSTYCVHRRCAHIRLLVRETSQEKAQHRPGATHTPDCIRYAHACLPTSKDSVEENAASLQKTRTTAPIICPSEEHTFAIPSKDKR